MSKQLIPLVLRSVALAMSVAVVVLSILNSAETEATISLLAIGLFTFVLASFVEREVSHETS